MKSLRRPSRVGLANVASAIFTFVAAALVAAFGTTKTEYGPFLVAITVEP